MTPFYFGTSRKPLFGMYDPPESHLDLNRGTVLCNSFGREQILTHRTFRQLATQLTRAGFHVLRFDYHGCGDSSGYDEDGTLAQWTEDISTAIQELRDFAGLQRASLIGFRLGASLAAHVETESRNLDSLVLWEPIISGREYVRELLDSQRAWLRDRGSRPDTTSETGAFEVLGFRVSASLRTGLEALDLLNTQSSLAPRTLVIEQSEKADARRLHASLAATGTDTDYRCVEAPRFWLKGELNKAQVPWSVVQSIVSWLAEDDS